MRGATRVLDHLTRELGLFAERSLTRAQTVKCGDLKIEVIPVPLSFTIRNAQGEAVQHIKLDRETYQDWTRRWAAGI